MSAGPAPGRSNVPATAEPVVAKMPAPMMAPMPRAVRSTAVSVRLRRCSGCSASTRSRSEGLVWRRKLDNAVLKESELRRLEEPKYYSFRLLPVSRIGPWQRLYPLPDSSFFSRAWCLHALDRLYTFSNPANFCTIFFIPWPGKTMVSFESSPSPSQRTMWPTPNLGWRT